MKYLTAEELRSCIERASDYDGSMYNEYFAEIIELVIAKKVCMACAEKAKAVISRRTGSMSSDAEAVYQSLKHIATKEK